MCKTRPVFLQEHSEIVRNHSTVIMFLREHSTARGENGQRESQSSAGPQFVPAGTFSKDDCELRKGESVPVGTLASDLNLDDPSVPAGTLHRLAASRVRRRGWCAGSLNALRFAVSRSGEKCSYGNTLACCRNPLRFIEISELTCKTREVFLQEHFSTPDFSTRLESILSEIATNIPLYRLCSWKSRLLFAAQGVLSHSSKDVNYSGSELAEPVGQ